MSLPAGVPAESNAHSTELPTTDELIARYFADDHFTRPRITHEQALAQLAACRACEHHGTDPHGFDTCNLCRGCTAANRFTNRLVGLLPPPRGCEGWLMLREEASPPPAETDH